MSEFLLLSRPVEALETLLQALPDRPPVAEESEVSKCVGRILFEDVIAPHPLPEFPRSTVDGYALMARDTFGVSDGMPGYLNLVGEVPMGAAPRFAISNGDCALIHTGGMLPAGADAVEMLEDSRTVKLEERKVISGRTKQGSEHIAGKYEIEISRAVAEGENAIRIGEDVTAGQVVLKKGIKMRPVEIGGCAAFGITKLRVARKPSIGIISTGDEIISPMLPTRPGQVRDVNSYSLAALVENAGGNPIIFGIVRDKLELLTGTARKALEECDAVVITAGSSASARDMTAEAINALGKPGILVHGINVRPGKPTILAVCDGKAVVGLPGNPVSALVIAGLFLNPVIEKLSGVKNNRPKPSLKAIMSINVPSRAGREDWVAVRLVRNEPASSSLMESGWLAEPVFGKSNLIFSLAAADGLVKIPPDVTGISAGEIVDVMLME